MAARLLLISTALALAACDQVSGLSDFEIGTGSGGQGGTAPQGGAAGFGDGGAAGAPVPPPCLVPPVDSPTTTITWLPDVLTTADTPVFSVTDTATPFAYVSLRLCTPAGPRVIDRVASIQCSSLRNAPPCTWTFDTEPLPAGTTQAAFSAMLEPTTVETRDVLVIK